MTQTLAQDFLSGSGMFFSDPKYLDGKGLSFPGLALPQNQASGPRRSVDDYNPSSSHATAKSFPPPARLEASGEGVAGSRAFFTPEYRII